MWDSIPIESIVSTTTHAAVVASSTWHDLIDQPALLKLSQLNTVGAIPWMAIDKETGRAAQLLTTLSRRAC